MGFLSFITGSKSIDKIVDGAMRAGDALFFTDEEKSIASQKKLDWTLEYMKATAPQNVSRRVIAFVIVILWALLVLVAVVAGGFARGPDSFSQFVFDTMKELVIQPFSIVVGFYFLTQLVRSARK
ncbi:MAG: hypothetical protein V3S49_04880 [Thermodesulfobacteriota bacterium]